MNILRDNSPFFKPTTGILMIVLAALVVLGGCAHQDEWTREDTIGQLIVTGTIVGDAYTTAQIQDYPHLRERGRVAGPILGDNPSTESVVLYFGSLALSNYLISRALPKKWRKYWQGGNIVAHGWAWGHNNRLIERAKERDHAHRATSR